MKRRTARRWQWAYAMSTGESFHIGADQVDGYRALVAKHKAAGKPFGSLWKRRVAYGPWRASC